MAARIPRDELAAFGRHLRRVRLSGGVRQADLAARMGLTQSMVAHWETGRVAPSLSQVVQITHHLGIEAAALLADLPRPTAREVIALRAHAAAVRSRAVEMVIEAAAHLVEMA
jgi:transcriptional regulator with XRE-family HTH domain